PVHSVLPLRDALPFCRREGCVWGAAERTTGPSRSQGGKRLCRERRTGLRSPAVAAARAVIDDRPQLVAGAGAQPRQRARLVAIIRADRAIDDAGDVARRAP